MALLTCKNLCVNYDNFHAVSDITFSIDKGDYVFVVGENGSGKSTLIKTIAGLLKPKSGEIIFGDDTTNKIGYLPQQTVIQRDFPASVYEVVLSGCLNSKGIIPFYTKKDKKRADENIAKLGIKHLKHKCYRELSGGQQQRVLLARALCATKNLLILDEPVAGLDPIVTAEMYKIIKKLNEENNITIIMVSHDIDSAVNNANKVLHMDNSLLFFGTSEEYKESEVGKKFLGGKHNVCDDK